MWKDKFEQSKNVTRPAENYYWETENYYWEYLWAVKKEKVVMPSKNWRFKHDWQPCQNDVPFVINEESCTRIPFPTFPIGENVKWRQLKCWHYAGSNATNTVSWKTIRHGWVRLIVSMIYYERTLLLGVYPCGAKHSTPGDMSLVTPSLYDQWHWR